METATGLSSVEELAGDFAGEVLRPSDPGYDDARRIYNGMIDRRPAVIARCAGTADVIAALRFAREQELPLAVRCGGHSVAGHSAIDDGVLVDLSLMRGVRVDPKRRLARAAGGAPWGDFDRETQAFGLATPGGRVLSTGVGGFTLGGGYGWISPAFGLTCDNLVSADVVTAEGELVTASEEEHADLFWALRGGGGNFGVVTSFEFRLHPVGPIVLGGILVFTLDRAPDVLSAWRDLAERAPDELATAVVLLNAPPEHFIPPELHGRPVLGMAVAWCGDPGAGEKVVSPIRDLGPIADLVGPMPYRALQSMLEPLSPHGWRNYWRGLQVAELSDALLEAYLGFAPEGLAPMTFAVLFQHGGAVGRVDPGSTAFAHRDTAFIAHPIGCWSDPAGDERHIAWVRAFTDAVQPHATGGVYLNFTADEGEDRVQAGLGEETVRRLAEVKAQYDPENVFRSNQNVKPALAVA